MLRLLGHGTKLCDGLTRRELMHVGALSLFGGDAPIGEAARLFVSHRIRRVPVMEGEKLIGIVSRSDIVRFFATRQWQCADCGLTDRGFEAPDSCPSCGAPAAKFKLTQAPPGM